MKLLKLQDEYLEYSKRFKSAGTYRFDKSHLPVIVDFLIEHGVQDTKQINFKILHDFIDHSRLNSNTNNTINKRIALLNRAIAFMVKTKRCAPSIIASFPKLKEIDKRFSVVTEEQMKLIIHHMMSKPSDFKGLRDKCIVFLFIDTGIRLSELTAIKTKNVDLENRVILLEETKSKKERHVYFSDITGDFLKNYINKLRDEEDIESLFRNSQDTSEPLMYLGVIRVLHRIRDELGLKKLSSHMIRHSYGTLAYKLKISMLFTKATMGHTRVEMTERYVHYDLQTNRKIYERFSPMNYYTQPD